MVSSEPPSSLTPEQLISSFQLLHLVAEALSHISSADDPASVTPAIARLHAKVAQCEALLDSLPGGAMTRIEQLAEIDRLRDALQRKRQMVRRYAQHDLVSRVLAQRAIPCDPAEGPNQATAQAQNAIANPESTQNPPAMNPENDSDAMRIDDSFGDTDYGFMGKI